MEDVYTTINPSYTIESCIICLENSPAPVHNLFPCGCKGIIHNTCLQMWNTRNNYQCIICRKIMHSVINIPSYNIEIIYRRHYCRGIHAIMCMCCPILICIVLFIYILSVIISKFRES